MDDLSENPNAIYLLEANPDKICWWRLSRNPNAIPLLEKNPDKICWSWISENLSIFEIEIDYEALQKRCLIYCEELIMFVFHPKRILAWLDAGFEDF